MKLLRAVVVIAFCLFTFRSFAEEPVSEPESGEANEFNHDLDSANTPPAAGEAKKADREMAQAADDAVKPSPKKKAAKKAKKPAAKAKKTSKKPTKKKDTSSTKKSKKKKKKKSAGSDPGMG